MVIELEYPSKVEEITLGQYQKYCSLFESDENYEPTVEDIINIFTNVSYRRLPIKDAERVSEAIAEALVGLESYRGFSAIITHENKQYGFIPNFDEITFGEYEDLTTALGSVDTFHNAMEVLYRPIKKRVKDLYDIEEYSGYGDRGDSFKNLPAIHFKGAMLFFYLLTNALTTHIQSYLREKEQRRSLEEAHLERDLVRSGQPIESL